MIAALQSQLRTQSDEIRNLNAQLKTFASFQDDKKEKIKLTFKLEEMEKEIGYRTEKGSKLEALVESLSGTIADLKKQVSSSDALRALQIKLDEANQAVHSRDLKLKELQDDLKLKNSKKKTIF